MNMDFPLKANHHAAALSLRLGLLFVFAYATIASFMHPNVWVGFLPPMLTDHIDGTTLLHVFDVYQIGLIIWLLSGRYLRWAALVTALTLAGITLSNPHTFDSTFRDVGLCLAAISLMWMENE
jgi:uncharacterized membrane protein YphA (DoxX/SURF4 family)